MVRTSHVYRERPPDVPNETEESGFRSEIGDFAKNGHLYAPVTATKPLQTTTKSPQSAMDYLELPLNSCRQLWAATKPLQTTANRHKIATKPLQIAADCHGLPQTTANSAKLSKAARTAAPQSAVNLHPGNEMGSKQQRPQSTINLQLRCCLRKRVTTTRQLRFSRTRSLGSACG